MNGLEAGVVDSSALICIAKSEPAAGMFLLEMGKTGKLYLAAPTYAEVILATMSLQGGHAIDAMDGLIASLKIETADFSGDDILVYKNAAMKYHVKSKPSGSLNMGDLFSLQLAMKMNLPLFFQGKDFLKTPVKNAMKMLGYEMNEDNLGVPTVHGKI
ncbi:MAG: type II toxin-antitoxin system VapC family toxin [Aeromicrobium sp.]|nr:type II toxin-antitoxin system VapC family toxin [Burkholderiales bacterium]